MRPKKSPNTMSRTARAAVGGIARKTNSTPDLVRRLVRPPRLEDTPALKAGEVPAPSEEDRINAAVGCKTTEVALILLAQLVGLDRGFTADATPERFDTWHRNASALLSELQPASATEALLAAQMVGAQGLAMRFLERATQKGQTVDGVDRNVLRATRLMRVFNEQVETMLRLKGKSGQQRVVVEHVTVAAGGQAIVGTVIPGGQGRDDDNSR